MWAVEYIEIFDVCRNQLTFSTYYLSYLVWLSIILSHWAIWYSRPYQVDLRQYYKMNCICKTVVCFSKWVLNSQVNSNNTGTSLKTTNKSTVVYEQIVGRYAIRIEKGKCTLIHQCNTIKCLLMYQRHRLIMNLCIIPLEQSLYWMVLKSSAIF